jgi:hypothetical protein
MSPAPSADSSASHAALNSCEGSPPGAGAEISASAETCAGAIAATRIATAPP